MNDLPQQIPQAERPERQSDDSLEQLEETFLDKQAKSAAYRAVFEHNQHVQALNNRIDVLQAKLDKREEDLHVAMPRVSELEQAERTSKVGTIVEAVGAGGGAILLSIASFMSGENWVKFVLFGAGVSASSLAVFAKLLLAAFGWPQRPTPRS